MKNNKFLKPRLIKLGEKISFKWMDRDHGGNSLGWAYFDVCHIRKEGIITKIFIYPNQQHSNETFFYKIPKDFKARDLSFSSYTFNNSDAVITTLGWCSLHKGVLSRIRVPKESEYFDICLHFGNTIYMNFHKEKKQ